MPTSPSTSSMSVSASRRLTAISLRSPPRSNPLSPSSHPRTSSHASRSLLSDGPTPSSPQPRRTTRTTTSSPPSSARSRSPAPASSSTRAHSKSSPTKRLVLPNFFGRRACSLRRWSSREEATAAGLSSRRGMARAHWEGGWESGREVGERCLLGEAGLRVVVRGNVAELAGDMEMTKLSRSLVHYRPVSGIYNGGFES